MESEICPEWKPQNFNAYVITVQESPSLFETEKQLSLLKFQVNRVMRSRDMQNGSRGCLESHKYVAQKILESKETIAFIAEDDCDVVSWNNEQFAALANIQLLDPKWDIISLGSTFRNGHEVLNGIYRTNVLSEMHAYLLSASGAEKISKLVYTTRAYDEEISVQNMHCYVCRPSMFFQRHWNVTTAHNTNLLQIDVHHALSKVGLEELSKFIRKLFDFRH